MRLHYRNYQFKTYCDIAIFRDLYTEKFHIQIDEIETPEHNKYGIPLFSTDFDPAFEDPAFDTWTDAIEWGLEYIKEWGANY